MSLRAFHLLFIALSIVMSALVGGWGLQRWLAGGEAAGLALGAFFFLFGFALVVYGVRTFRKLKELGR